LEASVCGRHTGVSQPPLEHREMELHLFISAFVKPVATEQRHQPRT
jgi:hypothetical protein